MQGQVDPLDEILHAAEPPLVLCPLGFERRAFLRFGKLPVVTTGPARMPSPALSPSETDGKCDNRG